MAKMKAIKKVAKKMIMRKVLSCLAIIAVLMSAMPISIVAMNEGSNNSTGNASNRSNENLLEKSFMENNSAEVIMPFLANNTIDMQHLAFNKTINNSNVLNTTVEPVTSKDKEESKNNSLNTTSNYQNKTVPILANSRKKILPVPYYNQDGTQWCQLASTSMILKYYGWNVHPEYIAELYSVTQDRNTLVEFFEGKFLHNIPKEMFENYDLTEQSIDFEVETIKNSLDQGYPIYLGLGKPIYHATVIVGYEETILPNDPVLFVTDPSGHLTKEVCRREKDPAIAVPILYSQLQEEVNKVWDPWRMIYSVQGNPNPSTGTIYVRNGDVNIYTEDSPINAKYSIKLHRGFSWFAIKEGRVDDITVKDPKEARVKCMIANQGPQNGAYELSLFVQRIGGGEEYTTSKTAPKNPISIAKEQTQEVEFDVIPLSQFPPGLYTIRLYLFSSSGPSDSVGPIPFMIEDGGEFTPLDLCMVLDSSSSMKDAMGGKTKIQGVKEAATGVVNVLLPQDRVSIVSFSHVASTDIDFTTDFNAVKAKINEIPVGGGTSFGAGLKLALDQFNAHGNPDHIPAILFMSDGHHNTDPAPDAFVTECKNKGIPIFTVGFASSESQVDVARLKRMSEETGGEYRFVSKIFDLQNVFLKLQHKASGWESIATYVGEVNQGETITAGSFYVDPAINNLRVTLNWPGSNLDLKLFDPSGRQVDFSVPNVVYSGDTKPEYVIVKDPQSGTWAVKVYGKRIGSSEKYYVLVTKYVPPKPQICKVQITSHSSLQDRPSIVYANGNYYVAYQSWEKGRGIFIKKFDSQWNFIKKVQVVSGSAYYDSPSLAFANNKLYVAYISNAKGATANDYDVIVKEYNPNSLACTRGEKYLTTLQSCQDLPALYYKDGYFYFAYQSGERGNGDIFIKKFDSNWNQIKKVQVTSKSSCQDRPSIIYANGYFYVTYHTKETGDLDIFVKRLDANLNLDSWKKQITSESSSQSYPFITFVNNEYTIVYASNEGGTLGIYLKKYDRNWNFIGKTKVVDDSSTHERRPSMTYAQNNYWIAYVHNLVGSDDWNIFAIIPGCGDGSSPTPTPTPTPKLLWEITVDKAEYSPGDYVHLTQQFTNEGEETVLITNPITTTFIASDGSIVLKEDLSSSISVTLGAGGQWSFGTSYKLPDDAPEGYYDVKVSISGGNYVKTAEDLFHVSYPV